MVLNQDIWNGWSVIGTVWRFYCVESTQIWRWHRVPVPKYRKWAAYLIWYPIKVFKRLSFAGFKILKVKQQDIFKHWGDFIDIALEIQLLFGAQTQILTTFLTPRNSPRVRRQIYWLVSQWSINRTLVKVFICYILIILSLQLYNSQRKMSIYTGIKFYFYVMPADTFELFSFRMVNF